MLRRLNIHKTAKVLYRRHNISNLE
uniref:Uncharacterized protein n=1 Tax=Anguilla anguilla TaxID=7936 RepID=A0A0E9V4H7_ANGAN